MRNLLHNCLMSLVVLVAIFCMVAPGNGVLYHNPLAVIGLGLIGVGLCKQERDRRLASPPPSPAPRDSSAVGDR
jgi:hypothetical protein